MNKSKSITRESIDGMTPSRSAEKERAGGLRLHVTSGSSDLINGLRRYDLWSRLGFLEIKRRYRRTVIGPFWSAISLGVFVAVMGAVGIGLWNQKASQYLPFLAAGLMVWLLISSIITESCTLFIGSQHLFNRMRINFSMLAYALAWRNLVAFVHNLIVYIIVVLIFAPHLIGSTLLLVIPGLFLIVINAAWIALILGMTCARFRDLQHLVTTVLQIFLFITPVFWPPELLTGTTRLIFVNINPVSSVVDVVRSPLIGHIPSAASYGIVIAMAIGGWILTYFVFSRFRRHIAFWV